MSAHLTQPKIRAVKSQQIRVTYQNHHITAGWHLYFGCLMAYFCVAVR